MKVSALSFGTAVTLGSLIDFSSAQRYARNYCPASCSNVGLVSRNWNVYPSVNRLSWCNQTMLVSFNVNNDLNNPETNVRLATCTSDADTSLISSRIATRDLAESSNSVVRPRYSNSTVPANSEYLQNSTAVVQVQTLTSGTSGGPLAYDLGVAASALQAKVVSSETINQATISFAYSNGAVVGVYSGQKINSTSTHNLLQQLLQTLQGSTADTIIMQVCHDSRNADYTMGVIAIADLTGQEGLSTAQGALAAWNNATCITPDGGFESSSSNMTVSQTAETPLVQSPTLATPTKVELVPRTTCSAIKVVSGDSCSALASQCGITPAQFTVYNPSSTECSTLVPGEWVCCSAGTLPDFAPQPYSNGTCYTYYVESGDTCSALAATWSLTIDDINNFNTETWGWTGCNDLLADEKICLSTGNPPMPAVISNAVCGPQVPGTGAPESGTTLSELNQCNLNACCDIWGQCGITAEFCTPSNSSTGAPGTAAAGQNGCISNCGTEIISSGAPAEVMRIAYFEGFNWDRPCLNMEASDIAGDTTYTHIHFAFANLTQNYEVALGDQEIQFQLFLGATQFKRIVSFGGWAFCTDPSTYNIFREGVTVANRATLVANIVSFVKQYGLDGVDIDWEYPGEPDIPGIPAGSIDDGVNYLIFLGDLRTALPSSASLSITAPSSFWYLQAYLIEATATVVDYIVFMTYDLHGQWDYGNKFTNPGCPTGNCLRSHVNFTETLSALSMITKAGVPSNQIAVGVASYARSFRMVDPTCTGPECLFTGPLSGALPGPCTETPGYVSIEELDLIIANSSIASTQYADTSSDSSVLVWDDNWAAYMTSENKALREDVYGLYNFAGTSDWAVDLQALIATSPDGSIIFSQDSTSSQICDLEYTTASGINGGPAAAGTIVSATWASSGAGTYLNTFLTGYMSSNGNLNGWLVSFFEKVIPNSSGGTSIGCVDIKSTCEGPVAGSCPTYSPPEAFFIHTCIYQLFNFYQDFSQAITQTAVSTLLDDLNEISDTFAPVDTTEALLFQILGGVLGTVAGLGIFIGDFDLDTVGAIADGIAAFSAMFQDTQIGSTPPSTATEALDEILGSSLKTVFDVVNKTIIDVFNPPNSTTLSQNITFIESFFLDGAYLDETLVDLMLDSTTQAFNATMNQYLIISAMQSASSLGPYSDGYCFLYSTNQYNTESDCTKIGLASMIWYDNTCIGFGTYTNTIDGGEDSTEISSTGFLDGSKLAMFQSYVPNMQAAIVNNYNCFLHPTADGTADWPNPGFDPSSLLEYPDCFFNLGAYYISLPA